GGRQGHHGREPAQVSRAASRQRGVPPRHGRLPPGGPADDRPRPRPGERAEGVDSVLHREGGRGGAAPVELQDAGAGGRQPDRGPTAGSAVARPGREREERYGARASAPGRHPDPGAGAAHRRAVLEVGPSGRQKGHMARIPFQKTKSIQWEMRWIEFQRRKWIRWDIRPDRYGRLVAEPFEKGYALTVGHSLRRTLLA